MRTNNTAADHEITFEDVAWAINEAAKRPIRETKRERTERLRIEALPHEDPFAIFD